MVIATLIETRTHSLVSFGEGSCVYQAKAAAIINCPKENEDVNMSECEWVIDNLDD